MFTGALKVVNQATKYVQKTSAKISKENSRALVSVSFELRKSLKEGITKEAPGGKPWPPTHPWTRYGILKKSKRRFKTAQKRAEKTGRAPKRRTVTKLAIGGKQTTALKRFASAARVKKKLDRKSDGTVSRTIAKVGFLTKSIGRLAEYHADAHQIRVTPKMRRFIFASGLFIKSSTIRIPARPHVENVYRANRKLIPDFIERRISAALKGKEPRSIRTRFR